MDESAYHSLCDKLFAELDTALESHPAELDFENTGGVIEIDLDEGGKIIINRQPPAREVWIAAKSGGYHFRFEDGQWRDTRDGVEIFARLQKSLQEQGASFADEGF